MNRKHDLNLPINDTTPIRVAVLGGSKTGKTSFVSKLTQGIFSDTYYPTIKNNTSLFAFNPREIARYILGSKELLGRNIGRVVLSKVLQSVTSNFSNVSAVTGPNLQDITINSSNNTFISYNYKQDDESKLPHITPILVEIIDTPAFNPNQTVPFLEASLYMNLDKSVLKNLANEPRRPVSTNPLLVASGAGELNGSIDGYFYVYSAIPSYNPPGYDAVASEDNSNNSSSNSSSANNNSFLLLETIKAALDDAWMEFYTFKQKWEEGKETDLYSLKNAVKTVLFNKNIDEDEKDKFSKRKFYKDLMELSKNPADANSPPPIWIICTHCDSPLASPNLIQDGINLSRNWECGFIALDLNSGYDDEKALALMIREITHRRMLQKQQH